MIIDLRSDTVTKPSKPMLEAMFSAELGDDVFSEDPTVIKLESKAADLFGMESALFCPSGTMTNQIAIRVHTRPGDELICDLNSHIYNYEGGGIASNSGVQARVLNGVNGKLSAELVKQNINQNFDWLARTSLVCLENTVNKAGGSIYELKEVLPIAEVCKKNDIKLHLDGARLFNALVETKEATKEWGGAFDSISICLSKGLGTPAGSLLLGKKDFIANARRVRKVFGGGMRQVGIIAASGIYALDNNIDRLKQDNDRAKQIGIELGGLPYVETVLPVESNIVIFKLKPIINELQFETLLKERGIKVSIFGKQTIRMVTHLDFTDDMLSSTIVALKEIKI